MLAAQIEAGTLRIGDVPKPEPGPMEALVSISAAGVCHSDLHMARGDWFEGMTSPLGHEGIGVVEALGDGAEQLVAVGDRVILGLGGAGGALLVRRVPSLPRRTPTPLRADPRADGHLRRARERVGARAGEDPRRAG